MKNILKTILLLSLFITLFGCTKKSSSKSVSYDSISNASTTYYYEAGSLKRESESFNKVMAYPSGYGAVVVSTTNEDGSPNAAVVIPSLVDEKEGYMLLAFGSNGNTKINIVERKLAVITVYKLDKDSEDKNEKHQGARLIVEYVDDQDPILNKLIESKIIKEETKSSSVIVKIVKVLPLG